MGTMSSPIRIKIFFVSLKHAIFRKISFAWKNMPTKKLEGCIMVYLFEDFLSNCYLKICWALSSPPPIRDRVTFNYVVTCLFPMKVAQSQAKDRR